MAEIPSFYDWLIKQKPQRTPLGEYARTAARDKAFPRDVASQEALLEYVRVAANGSSQAVVMARTAYQTYVRMHRPAPTL